MPRHWIIHFLLALLPLTAAQARPLKESDIRTARRIVVFLGTFEPIHAGHLGTAEAALRETDADLVLFLPNPSPIRKDSMPVEKRLEMISVATDDSEKIMQPSQDSFRDVLLRQRTTGSLIAHIRKLNPRIRVDLLAGSDVASNDITVAQAHLAIRPDRWLAVSRENGQETRLSPLIPRDRIQWIRNAPTGHSSTAIRQHLTEHPELYFVPQARDQTPVPHLPRKVADYILDRGIFLGHPVDNRITPKKKTTQLVNRFLEWSALSHPVRSIAIDRLKTDAPAHVLIDGKKHPVRKTLGTGLRGAAYLVDIDGRPHALKVANSREGSDEILRRSVWVQKWVALKTGIPVPKLVAADPSGAWALSEYIEGEPLDSLLARPQTLPADLTHRLSRVVREASELERSSNIKLDLRADNLIVRDGIPYLVDLGTLDYSKGVPRDFDQAMNEWKAQSDPRQVNAIARAAGTCLKAAYSTLKAIPGFR